MGVRNLWRGSRRGAPAAVLLVLSVMGVGLSATAPGAASAAAVENRSPADAGASLPVSYNLAALPGSKVFVSPAGSDSGDGSQARPFKTLPRAASAAGSGSVIVLRGGTYPIAGNNVSVTKKLSFVAYPGEVPVFDGSVAAPTAATSEGSLRWFPYTPMPAKPGQGLSITALPKATFSGSTPTGLAASRGWRCVAGNGGYVAPTGSGAGCPSGYTPRVISGFYPDQVWVGGKPLVQVLDKSKVVPGAFFVQRSAATDAAPGASRLYLSSQDAAAMGQVRVSKSSGTFFLITASGVRIEGIKVVRHSPSWRDNAIQVSIGAHDVTVKNVEMTDVESAAVEIMGGEAAGGGQITKRTTLDKVTIDRAQWMGLDVNYTDDTRLLNVKVTGSNPDAEFVTAPKSGGMKATKTQRMQVIGSVFSNNNSHGLWWDQSSYDSLVANSKFIANRDSGVFYEISHGLTMVNNLVVVGQSASTSPAVRLAGASASKLVNNTIVGSQSPLVIAGDARAKTYGSGRPCVEHAERYRSGGNYGTDCPPGLSSDLDKARPGAYGTVNLTPGMTWRPSATMIVNNVIANPTAGGGGICSGGYPLCIKGYSGSVSSPTATFKTNQILAGTVLNGNVYQAGSAVAEIRVQNGGSGGVVASTLAQYRSALAAGWYGLNAEANGLAGTGWVSGSGVPTAALNAKQGQAAAVPGDSVVNVFVPAGSKRYGSSWTP